MVSAGGAKGLVADCDWASMAEERGRKANKRNMPIVRMPARVPPAAYGRHDDLQQIFIDDQVEIRNAS
jgi:hypothetical protein